jgi:hypothetical protein
MYINSSPISTLVQRIASARLAAAMGHCASCSDRSLVGCCWNGSVMLNSAHVHGCWQHASVFHGSVNHVRDTDDCDWYDLWSMRPVHGKCRQALLRVHVELSRSPLRFSYTWAASTCCILVVGGHTAHIEACCILGLRCTCSMAHLLQSGSKACIQPSASTSPSSCLQGDCLCQ